MDVARAAQNTLTIWQKKSKEDLPAPMQIIGGKTLGHQHWLLVQVREEGLVDGTPLMTDKANRWLGYAQGYLVAEGVLTLEECKFANLLA